MSRLPRLCFLHVSLAWGEWRARRMAAALERLHGLPAGWLLIEGNVERWRDWQSSLARWQAAQEATDARR